eukprot:TRINITY_DN825_c0_g2_i1.p1 TRINITY_DN825_c0_g2~~TRINITY_DN825_c0_g2_i1.p1  ORF type:complete len:276 (+),score=119.72 TRINITY_DN825_c0_g2_i1:44-829(+)
MAPQFIHDEVKADFATCDKVNDGSTEAVRKLIDHTILKPFTTPQMVIDICNEAIENKFRAVCIPPCYVKTAAEALKDTPDVMVCTVIGFPNGYNTLESKAFETKQAVEDGADEVDYVQNVGHVKANNYEAIEAEARAVVAACAEGSKNKTLVGSRKPIKSLVKVILETANLEEEEIKKCTYISAKARVDIIKTSTGFASRGACPRDIELMNEELVKVEKETGVKHGIKAAGGVACMKDAQMMVAKGASRIGTSRGKAIMSS